MRECTEGGTRCTHILQTLQKLLICKASLRFDSGRGLVRHLTNGAVTTMSRLGIEEYRVKQQMLGDKKSTEETMKRIRSRPSACFWQQPHTLSLYEGRATLTPLSVKLIEIGPKPFHRIRFMRRFFSSPVSSSTTVVTTDAGLAL